MNENKISGYQRVINAVQGIKMERPPASLLLSLYGSKYTSSTLKDYYSIPEKYLEGQQAIVNKFEPDIVSAPFVLPFEGEIFGSKLKYHDNSPPHIKTPAIEKYNEIRKISLPQTNIGCKKYIQDSVELLVKAFKHEKFIAGITLSGIDSPAMIMGIEGWLDTLLFHQNEANILMEITSEYFIQYSNALFDAGIDVLVIPSAFSNPEIITEKLLVDVTLKYLSDSLKLIKGPVIIHNGGARIVDFLPYLINLENVAGFFIDENEDFDSARKLVGNKLLLGNLALQAIKYKTEETLVLQVKETLNDRQNDPNYIFYNAGANILLDTNESNIKAVFNTVYNNNQ